MYNVNISNSSMNSQPTVPKCILHAIYEHSENKWIGFGNMLKFL